MTYADDFTMRSMEDLTETIDSLGFVPFFANDIRGFSIEEHVTRDCWYGGSEDGFWPVWEWKGPIIQQKTCAYGKFYKGKAMYISMKWFPDFANYRRDGYDFDARYEDGLARRDDKVLYELIEANEPILSKPLKKLGDYRKGGKKGFDSSVTRLQKHAYVVISDFRYLTDRNGNEYGWGVAEYATPEKFYGKEFTDNVYRRTPEESYERIMNHFQKILPGVDEKALEKIIT